MLLFTPPKVKAYPLPFGLLDATAINGMVQFSATHPTEAQQDIIDRFEEMNRALYTATALKQGTIRTVADTHLIKPTMEAGRENPERMVLHGLNAFYLLSKMAISNLKNPSSSDVWKKADIMKALANSLLAAQDYFTGSAAGLVLESRARQAEFYDHVAMVRHFAINGLDDVHGTIVNSLKRQHVLVVRNKLDREMPMPVNPREAKSAGREITAALTFCRRSEPALVTPRHLQADA